MIRPSARQIFSARQPSRTPFPATPADPGIDLRQHNRFRCDLAEGVARYDSQPTILQSLLWARLFRGPMPVSSPEILEGRADRRSDRPLA